MVAETRPLEELAARLERLGMKSSVLEAAGDRTVTLKEDGERRALREGDHLRRLPKLMVDEEGGQSLRSDLVATDTLGEGGMGLVRLANQVALDREVALKTVRDDRHAEVAQTLLQEALVTGYLEHPNIIPIYTVGQSDDGAPLIVMKRVEGISWHDHLRAQRQSPEGLGLEDEVEVLIQVCHALEYAHSKGVLHRDIKTDNIMIGHFGEVYLLDWGLAVSIDGEQPLLPTLDQSEALCGTPCYMAPEMAHQDREAIDERTDVYLLGATLHEVMVGRPRHGGEKIIHMLFNASQSEPVDYEEAIPEELARIANRACHREPSQRFESVADFRQALEAFLEHRQSVAISDEAHRVSAQLRERLDRVGEAGEADELRDLLTQCRFGYRQALKLWPRNPGANRGLQEVLEAMAAHYLDNEKVEAARACLIDMPTPNEALQRRLEALEERLGEEEQELKRLQKLEDDLDLNTSRRTRAILILTFGVIWSLTSLYAAFELTDADVASDETMARYVRAGLRNVAIVLVGIGVGWKKLNANTVNRQLAMSVVALFGLTAIFRWGVWELGGDMNVGSMGEALLIVLFLFFIGLISDLRICLVGIPFLATALVTVLMPAIYLWIYPVAVLLTALGLAWFWSPGQIKHKITL